MAEMVSSANENDCTAGYRLILDTGAARMRRRDEKGVNCFKPVPMSVPATGRHPLMHRGSHGTVDFIARQIVVHENELDALANNFLAECVLNFLAGQEPRNIQELNQSGDIMDGLPARTKQCLVRSWHRTGSGH